MFEFKKLCDSFEKLTAVERGLLLTQKSAVVFAELHALSIAGIDPVEILAGFIIGSVTADGKINEQEYLLMYPALIRAFGDDFDLNAVKETLRRDNRKAVTDYTEEMIFILGLLDESLQYDVITLCLCITSIDGKISLREKRYLRRLIDSM